MELFLDELSSATELGLHGESANSDEHQRITTNQVQDIGPENDHHSTAYDNGSKEDHRITIQETPDCYEKMNDIPEMQTKAILVESGVPSLSGIEKLKDSVDAWLSETQKGPFRDEHGEEQDIKDYVKEELTKIWITLSSLSLHVSECRCKNVTSSSILELNNEREKLSAWKMKSRAKRKKYQI